MNRVSKIELGESGSISVATPTDLEWCAEITANQAPWSEFDYTPRECLEKLKAIVNLGGTILVIRQAGELAGYCGVSPKGFSGSPEIAILCVDDKFHGQGLGTQLMSYAEERVFSVEKNLFLRVSDFNEGAIRFYERCGFKRIGEIENYNRIGQSEYLYRKTVGPRR